jgi:drug/metabolite transporter (DMT)-like permease
MTATPRAPVEAMPAPGGALQRLWGSAWLLLAVAALCWAGNAVIGRAVRFDVPPVALAFWRWTLAFCIVISLARPYLARDLPILRRHWGMLLALSLLGVGAFNTMLYRGLQSTTAINAVLLQSAMPLIILLAAFLLFGERPGWRQMAGVAVSLAGVAVIAGRGSATVLAHLRLNPGDMWVLAAVVCYALYSALLRRRPPVHPMSLLAASFLIGALMLLPLYLLEHASGARISGSLAGYAAIGFVAAGPGFLAYLCFNRGVELIGPGRAGQAIHLVPLFGALLAVLLLGERFRAFHAAGFGLIAAGILLASLRPGRRPDGRSAAVRSPSPGA